MKTKAVKRAEAIARNKKHTAKQTARVLAMYPDLNAAGVHNMVQHMQGVPMSERTVL